MAKKTKISYKDATTPIPVDIFDSRDRNVKLPQETRGSQSSADILAKDREKQFLEERKKECLAKGPGWFWDAATNTCKRRVEIIQPEGQQDSTPQRVAGQYNAERGGFVADDGRFFPTDNPDFQPGESDKDVKFTDKGTVIVTGADNQPVELTKEEYETAFFRRGGAQTNAVQQAQAQPNRQQVALQNAIARIGQPGGLTPAQEAEINWSQAFTAGTANTIAGVIGGAGAGAIGGAAVGGIGAIPGAIGGALVGGIGTFISGTLGNIKEQQMGEIGAAKEELTSARTNMRQLAMLASRDPTNADYYISLYNQQLTRVYQAQRQTQLETSGDLNAWIDDGRDTLAEYEVFLRPGGIADIYGQKLRVSLQTGVPLSITGDQLFLDETGGENGN